MDKICIYLRKSRADMEAEARGEGETLAKHKKALLDVAKKQNLNITRIRQEIVSGESLIHRPEMMELLNEVESGLYDGVLVMDMDRLGRGNMQEQGIILETFQRAKTKIITPRKTYDLNDEWDEEYSEFEAFMARKELKIITRRLQGGRIRSVEEGNYIATRPPYGYLITNDEKGRYLMPHPDQAPVVKMIFDLYNEPLSGAGKIAKELNRLGYLSYTGKRWHGSSVLSILKNAVYVGRIQWKKKSYKKLPVGREAKARPTDEWIDVEGKHEPLISKNIWDSTQNKLKGKYHIPYQLNGITNPLAGLVRCEMCNKTMVYRSYTKQQAHLICSNTYCKNKSTRFTFVEERLLTAIEQWVENIKLSWNEKEFGDETSASIKIESHQNTIKNLKQELSTLEEQKGKLHDFLERGIYNEETYLERSSNLANRISEVSKSLEENKRVIEYEKKREEAYSKKIPKVKSVLEQYPLLNDPKKKNTLLKGVLSHATYRKEQHQKNDQFTLKLSLRI
ncbi:Site-specific DNA recombinase [Marininema halotolerans]|uniref:Site-specific DNA recombinase n=1 Tax=Marininema halotolerans TaxID=1155944 RepID=A0A1I6UR65_9BACL|nr:Site-specific DNA recombinase [Marininema halotolerans]